VCRATQPAENSPATVNARRSASTAEAKLPSPSLSACQLLWFLPSPARRNGLVERYVDEALGVLDKTWNLEGTLRPVDVLMPELRLLAQEHAALHERAHEKCFIANSGQD